MVQTFHRHGADDLRLVTWLFSRIHNKISQNLSETHKLLVTCTICFLKAAYLLKVMDGQPYLSHAVVHTSQVAPRHCKRGLGLDGLGITHLQPVEKGGGERWDTEENSPKHSACVQKCVLLCFIVGLDTLDKTSLHQTMGDH